MKIRDRIETSLESWGHTCFRHRWLILIGMTALTLALGSGMKDLRFDMSSEGYLDPQDPARVTYDNFRRQFDSDDSILVMLETEDVFSLEFLSKVRDLHHDIEDEVPLVTEVESLLNARFTFGQGDELIVGELLEEWPQSEADLRQVEERVRANPIYINTLISENGRFATITVKATPGNVSSALDDAAADFGDLEEGAPGNDFQERLPVFDEKELDDLMTSLFEVVKRYETEDERIYISGNPELSYALTVTARDDMTLFSGLTNLIIGILLLILFRRFSGMFLPLLVVLLPLASTLGIMGHIGLPLTPSTQQLPSLLVAICIGDAVHLLAIFYRKFDQGSSKEDAMAYALRHSGLAVVMTSLTTAGGLGSFMAADLAPTVGLGIAAPTGVILALLYSLTSLPALVAILPLRRRKHHPEEGKSRTDRGLAAFGNFATRHPWSVVGVWSVLGFAAIYGAFHLEVSHKPLSWFPEDFPTRVAAEVANTQMKGMMPLEVLVDSGEENGLHDPELLRRIEAFQAHAKSLNLEDMVAGQAVSVVDVLKETHRALNSNDPAFYSIPQDRALVAQELLLFENSGSEDLEDLVDAQFQTARVNLLVSYDDGFKYIRYLKLIDDSIEQTIGDAATVETTGLIKLWVRTISAMLSSTAKSYIIALLIIAPLMVLLIGEWRMGLLSLIPNLLPIIMGLGLMKLCGISFNMFTMSMGSIVIGMAVDDTIHFMHGYLRYHRQGLDAPEAVRATLLSTGRALLITSLALSTGFFVQMFGTMISIRHAGFITGAAILLALLADLLLSPALVTLADRFARRAR